ncbi:MAG TPA: DUF362 domain-containing protein, partial [Syntrophales bacterium]|nr:DUF362 domain-containing protein [Syntrophales bacterium]HPQ43400.1 DUF362 domain-containing protein [Syntrophales bacterium]
MNLQYSRIRDYRHDALAALKDLLTKMNHPFHNGDSVGIKLHWGERGNHSYLPPEYAREIVRWLKKEGVKPFIFDTTVLYSGGRRRGEDSLATAVEHGFTEEFLGCEVVIADGLEGMDVVDIPGGLKHFSTVQVASVIEKTQGFIIFSHFKGHLGAGFGGAIKNISMGFASRAQKQRMHADAYPSLREKRCTRCGVCVDICPTGAAQMINDEFPSYDLEKCIGCAQCIAMCPVMALKIHFSGDAEVFQEKLVETAAAVWKRIRKNTICINALINITPNCDCMPGKEDALLPDIGFIGEDHPVMIDRESLKEMGENLITATHPHVPWQRQFEYAKEIGFLDS